MTTSSGLHRIEGLAVHDQGHRDPLDSGHLGTWWRKGQFLLGHGRKDEDRREAEETLRLDPSHCGARQLLESL